MAWTFKPSLSPVSSCLNFYQLGAVFPCTDSCTTSTITRIETGKACSNNNQNQIGHTSASSTQACLEQCIEMTECYHFLYFDKSAFDPNQCYLYSRCPDTTDCLHCESGHLYCLPDPIYPSSSTTPDTTEVTTSPILPSTVL